MVLECQAVTTSGTRHST